MAEIEVVTTGFSAAGDHLRRPRHDPYVLHQHFLGLYTVHVDHQQPADRAKNHGEFGIRPLLGPL